MPITNSFFNSAGKCVSCQSWTFISEQKYPASQPQPFWHFHQFGFLCLIFVKLIDEAEVKNPSVDDKGRNVISQNHGKWSIQDDSVWIGKVVPPLVWLILLIKTSKLCALTSLMWYIRDVFTTTIRHDLTNALTFPRWMLMRPAHS